MSPILQTLAIAIGLSLPFLYHLPHYSITIFTSTLLYNHFFPTEPRPPNYTILPHRRQYLQTLKPLDDTIPVEGQHCPSCWEELNPSNDPMTLLPCNHTFCKECILQWLDNNHKNTCPVCKTVLFQQATFSGQERFCQIIHEARTIVSLIDLLVFAVRQTLCFTIRHPPSPPSILGQLNPIFYLTGYGSLAKTIAVAATVFGDVAQVYLAVGLGRRAGVYWWKSLPGKDWMWAGCVFAQALQVKKELDDLPVYWGVARGAIVVWWSGRSGFV